MNNIEIARQTIKITAERYYILDGEVVKFPDVDYRKAELYPPEMGAQLLEREPSGLIASERCRFSVTNEDSFQAARRYDRPYVMNFANAHCPGGGFKLGANAQEESLCRCSTLYASITSQAAAPMYRYNNSHVSSVESDHMIFSPDVLVFRDINGALLSDPFLVSVVTVPAPNRHGAALFAGAKVLAETMRRRIRILLRIAEQKRFRNLVLGAWGCGAFGNRPEEVAGHFKTVLVDEEFGRYFDEVCFAIYGKEDGANIREFRKVFEC